MLIIVRAAFICLRSTLDICPKITWRKALNPSPLNAFDSIELNSQWWNLNADILMTLRYHPGLIVKFGNNTSLILNSVTATSPGSTLLWNFTKKCNTNWWNWIEQINIYQSVHGKLNCREFQSSAISRITWLALLLFASSKIKWLMHCLAQGNDGGRSRCCCFSFTYYAHLSGLSLSDILLSLAEIYTKVSKIALKLKPLTITSERLSVKTWHFFKWNENTIKLAQ